MQQSSNQNNNEQRSNIKKIQWLRMSVQLIFVAILIGGLYKFVKPAFVVILPLAFLAGNFFCGWLCPFGTAQEIFGKLGSFFIKKKFKVSPSLQLYLQFSRYILAAIVLAHIVDSFVDLSSINAYKTFMRAMSGNLAQTVATFIMGTFLVVALFFERPFCNYFCPEGIKFGLASLTRFFSIKRNSDTCIHCKCCDKACPMNIEVSKGNHVRNAQCINCFKCIAACPKQDTLTYGRVNPLQRE
ncbi:MAG: 4Fe-4S binding protein [Acidaminococcaceae bacterium]